MQEGFDKKEYIKFHVRRRTTSLYKDLLFILEDLKEDQYNISDKVFSRMRKRVLDSGNEAIRELDTIIDQIKIWKKLLSLK